ncbi:MAG: arylsulfotransferase family protein [Solirubrobacterales bacterium]
MPGRGTRVRPPGRSLPALAAVCVLVAAAIAAGESSLGSAPHLSAHGGSAAIAAQRGGGVVFGAPTLYPRFDPARRHYVARCGGGSLEVTGRAGGGSRIAVGPSRPRSGRFRVRVPVSPGRDFAVRVSGRGSGTYRVRCLPDGFPDWSFRRFRRSGRGMFMVSVNGSGSRGPRPWVIVFDQGGTPRWWFSPPTRTLWAEVLRNGTVTWPRAFGDGYGINPRSGHEVRTLSGKLIRILRTRGSVTDGHEYQPLPNGDVLLDTYDPQGGVDLHRFGTTRHGPRRGSVVFAEVQEVAPSGRVVWRWNSRRHISLAETGRWWHNVLGNPHPGPRGVPTFDPVHINTIEPWGHHRLVIATRHTDAVFGLDRRSGRILWKLGGTRTPRSLRFVGDPHPARELFGGPHDARIDSRMNLSVYDDATHRPRPPRLARYHLNLRRRTATFLGQLTDPEVTRSHCCGSARPFAGGWLVDWGDNPLLTGFDRRGRIAFRLRLPKSTYRAAPVPASISPARLDRGLERMEGGR